MEVVVLVVVVVIVVVAVLVAVDVAVLDCVVVGEVDTVETCVSDTEVVAVEL